MSFIGIIANEKNENYIRRELIKKLNLTESSVLFIKEKSIENIKNIKFETILLAREFENKEILKKLLLNTKYLIINSDIENNLNILDDIQLTVITYGFNSKSTITASSVDKDNILICIQRNIEDKNGELIESQEIKVNNKNEYSDTITIMGLTAIFLIYRNNNA